MEVRVRMRQKDKMPYMELVAEDRRETRFLRILFDFLYHDARDRELVKNSFGYDSKAPLRKAQKEGNLQFWADRQVLTFKPTEEAKVFIIQELWKNALLKKDLLPKREPIPLDSGHGDT
jgi:hypothetical protein